jgi:type IV pili sensor histidine kinase/response regulator
MPAIRFLPAASLALAAMLASACATTAPDAAPPPGQALSCATSPAPEAKPKPVPVTRHGRYALVELSPEPAQRDLMRQIIEVSLPPTLDAGVGDALRHVLQRSGYRLCEDADAEALYRLPLPAAHLSLGPLTLRDALATLAGPAWDMSVDDASRRVCFERQAAPDAAGLPSAQDAAAGEAGPVQEARP